MTLPWINASSAYQLLQCPRRWIESVAPSGVVQKPPVKASPTEAQVSGTLVHGTVEQWIKSGLWKDPDSDGAVADQFRTSAKAKGLPLGRTRILAAYLQNLLRDLRNVLDEGITEASAEKEVTDTRSRMRGKIDVLVYGTRVCRGY